MDGSKKGLTKAAGLLLALATLLVITAAAEGQIPNRSYPSNELFTKISPQLGDRHHNQPTVINGYLLLAGNAVHEFWDISNPYSPVRLSELFSPHRFGEAESHQVSYAKSPNGRLYLVTISGRGIDLWRIDNVHAPQLLSALELPKINYGDIHNAVWGVAWQGDYIYVGATTSGLYIVDASDPTQPRLLTTIPTSKLGGVAAGPLFALGNLLVITAPNHQAGVVTMDISDPANPTLLDFVKRSDNPRSYIGSFYGQYAYLQRPFDTYDVTTDPRNINLIGSVSTPRSEYMSFGDRHLFLGGERGGSEGIWKYDIGDPNDHRLIGRIPGRDGRWDDQFSVPIGNLIAISDDQNVNGYVGSYIAVHDTEPDTQPPVVEYVNPPDGAVDQALSSRIGLSFSDQIEFSTVDSSTLIVRPTGGQALTGRWGYSQTVVSFWPDQPLQADTSYEVVAVAGGITDLVGNALANDFRSVFDTGAASQRGIGGIDALTAVETGQNTDFVANPASESYEYRWEFGDGQQASGASVSHSYDAPGRYAATLSVLEPDGQDDFEAEEATLSGGVSAASNHGLYFGSGYADYPATTGSNVKVQWQIQRTSAGDAYIDVRYANGSASDRSLDLVVNGNTIQAVVFKPTGGWEIWQIVTIDDVALVVGNNTLELIARSSTGPNVDRLRLPSETTLTVLASYSATQIVHRPLTANEPARSSTVIVTADQARAWAVNSDADTVTAVDTRRLNKAFETNVGLTPRTLAQAPDGTIWVVNEGSHDISVLDSGNGVLIDTIDLPYASMPYGIAFAPDGSAAYVTLQALGRLLRIDPAARTIVHSLALGPDASGIVPKLRGIAIDNDSNRILVTRFVSPEWGGEIYDVDVLGQTTRTRRIIALAIDPGPDTTHGGRGIPNYISSLAISPDGVHARVPSKKDNIERGVFRDGQALTHESAVRTVISQIDLPSGHEDLAGRIDLDEQDMAFALAFSPLGDLLFTAIQGKNTVTVIDVYSGVEIAGIPTGLAPQGLTLDDQGRLYVQNFMSRSLSVFDVATLLTGTENSAQLLAEIDLVANETLSDEVLLGKQIFYDASSSKMSLEGYISCASCHLDGGQDGRTWDFTDRGEGLRNTISLQGRGGVLLHGPAHWTGNFDEIQDFENDIRSHFGGSGFMSDEDFNSGTRSDPLGDPKAGLSTELDALAAYVSSLTSVPFSPYRNADGSLTAEGELGKQVFANEGCGNCHSGTQFTDSAPGVLHDIGTISSASGGRSGQLLAGFDTPTLKGVWATAPYLHDGSALTLSQAVDAHSDVSLSESALRALVSYLQQIDETPPPPPPPSPRGGGPPGGGGTSQTVPDAPMNLRVEGGDGQVTLTWEAPEDDGGSEITDYEYRINGQGSWISIGSTETTHTVTSLVNGTEYTFQVRVVNAAGSSPYSNRAEATPGVGALDFAHFANGEGITSDFVFVNVATHPIRLGLDFYDKEGNPIAAETVVDVTEDLEITEDGSLSVRTAMEPLGELTISTHGQGEVVSGSVKVVSNGPIGGVLRFDLPGIGVAGVGASPPVRDALFPARREGGGISTAAAIHNIEEEAIVVSCRLMSGGVVLEEMEISLAAYGQEAQFIEEMFTTTDTSNFVGLVRCTAPGRFTGVAVELDAASRIFTTLPVVPVNLRGRGREAVLDFAHFANGEGITSDLVFVNVETQPSGPAPTPFHVAISPIRPALYFYDKEGNPIAAESVVEITGDLEVRADGGLSVQTEMEPLGELTISTHGQGELVSGSVRVVSDGPIGGVLRFDLPGIGVAGVGASQPARDALFPARRQGGLSTAAAIHNLGEEAMVVSCRLMKEGAVLEEEEIPLEANGQEARYIEQMFTRTDTSDFAGSVRCTAPEGRTMFTGVAVELDASNQHLHHATGGAGAREDVSGIDKGRDPVVQGLSRGREGGVIRRDEGGAPRFDAPAGGYFRVLFSGFYPQKGYNPSLFVGVLFLGFQSDDLFTGVVAPTTCSLATCSLTT